MKKDFPMNGCGGLSDVYVHADRHMHIYGTAKETEPKLKKNLLMKAPNKTAMKNHRCF
jgi:hypothetical protein